MIRRHSSTFFDQRWHLHTAKHQLQKFVCFSFFCLFYINSNFNLLKRLRFVQYLSLVQSIRISHHHHHHHRYQLFRHHHRHHRRRCTCYRARQAMHRVRHLRPRQQHHRQVCHQQYHQHHHRLLRNLYVRLLRCVSLSVINICVHFSFSFQPSTAPPSSSVRALSSSSTRQ